MRFTDITNESIIPEYDEIEIDKVILVLLNTELDVRDMLSKKLIGHIEEACWESLNEQ
jgi:hypothetical protein